MASGLSGLLGQVLDTYVYKPYLMDLRMEKGLEYAGKLGEQQYQNTQRRDKPILDMLKGGQPNVPPQFIQPPQQPVGPPRVGQTSAPLLQNLYTPDAAQPGLAYRGPAPDDIVESGLNPAVYDTLFGGESKGDYNAIIAGGAYTPEGFDRKPTEMTIDEVVALQGQMKQDPSNRFETTPGNFAPSSAIGRAQFVEPTLKQAASDAGLKGSDLFSEENQRKMEATLVEPMFKDYKAGKITRDELQNKLNSTFASVQNAAGGSRYNQPADTTAAEIDAAMSAVDQAERLDQGKVKDTSPAISNSDDLSHLAATGQNPQQHAAEDYKERAPRYTESKKALNGIQMIRAMMMRSADPNVGQSGLNAAISGYMSNQGQMARQLQEQGAGFKQRASPYVGSPRTSGVTGVTRQQLPSGEWVTTDIGTPSQPPPQLNQIQGLNQNQFTLDPATNQYVKSQGPRFSPRESRIPPTDRIYAEVTRDFLDSYSKEQAQFNEFKIASLGADDLYKGFGGDFVQSLRKVGGALGIGSLAEDAGRAELFEAVGSKIALAGMGEQAMGPYSDKDLAIVFQSAPTLSKTEAGVKLLLEARERQLDKSKAFFEYWRKSGKDTLDFRMMGDFEAQYQYNNSDLLEKMKDIQSGGTGGYDKPKTYDFNELNR